LPIWRIGPCPTTK